MYMVISKPKRMSTNDGVVHCMKNPPFALLKCTLAHGLCEEPGLRRFVCPHSLTEQVLCRVVDTDHDLIMRDRRLSFGQQSVQSVPN
jgi:hypothetical protein